MTGELTAPKYFAHSPNTAPATTTGVVVGNDPATVNCGFLGYYANNGQMGGLVECKNGETFHRWYFNEVGDFDQPQGSIFTGNFTDASKQPTVSVRSIFKDANNVLLGGSLVSNWGANDRTNQYWRNAGGVGAHIFEVVVGNGRRDFGFNWNDKRIFSPLGYVAQEGSDIKLKENIVDAKEGALERISSINTKEFNWKESNRKDRGFIAQDLQEIDPIYVYEGGDPCNPVLNVSHNALFADLIASIKELKAEIETLKSKVNE